jgi:putative transposase
VKYAWIQQHSSEFAVETMCRFMQVSRSAYYAWLQRPESVGEKEDAELTELIKSAFCQESGDLWNLSP